MYEWRKISPDERQRLLDARRQDHQPWHSPPHYDGDGERQYLISAACFEHIPLIGKDPQRLAACEQEVLDVCRSYATDIFAWCMLPNHYHILLQTGRIKELLSAVGRFHGRSSREWNLQDAQVGRKCWYRCMDRAMRSARHYWTSLNYVHHNPVRHGYVKRWLDWPYSSAIPFIQSVGRETAEDLWRNYPLLDYGKDWDPF